MVQLSQKSGCVTVTSAPDGIWFSTSAMSCPRIPPMTPATFSCHLPLSPALRQKSVLSLALMTEGFWPRVLWSILLSSVRDALFHG
jgi:hypothetical protein